MSKPEALKPFPIFSSDQEAEDFVDTADLSEYDFSGFRPARFEIDVKTANLSIRLPEKQLAAVKAEAEKRGVSYQKFIGELIERGMQTLERL